MAPFEKDTRTIFILSIGPLEGAILCDLWPNMMFGKFAKLPYQQQLFPGACCCMCICKAALVEIFRWRDLITSANIANCQLKGTHHRHIHGLKPAMLWLTPWKNLGLGPKNGVGWFRWCSFTVRWFLGCMLMYKKPASVWLTTQSQLLVGTPKFLKHQRYVITRITH